MIRLATDLRAVLRAATTLFVSVLVCSAAAEPAATNEVMAVSPTNSAEQLIAWARAQRASPEPAAIARLAELLADERLTVTADAANLGGIPTSPATEARKALEALGTPALPALTGVLNGTAAWRAQARAAEALGRIGEPGAVPELIKALTATSRMVRLAATDALVQLGTGVVPLVRAHLDRVSAPDAEGALVVLGRLRDEAAADRFLRYIDCDDEHARIAAGSAFARLGTNVVDRLIAGWDEADETTRLRLIQALERGRSPQARDHLLLAALAEAQPAVRRAAIRALATMRDDLTPLVLVIAQRDPDVEVRATASELCRTIGSNEAASVVAWLDHDSPVIWQGVSRALAQAAPAAAGPLVERLRDQTRSRDHQRRLAWVLVHMDNLSLAYEDSMRLWIAAEDWQVLNIFTESIPGPLAQAATNSYSGLRVGALSTMAVNRLRGSEDYLLAALDDPEPAVVRTAQHGIAGYGYGLVLRLEQLVQRGSVRASRAAAGALDEIRYHPLSQAMAVEYNASREATGDLMALGGMVPTHLLRRLERSQDAVESSRLAFQLASALAALVPDDRFGMDNVVVRSAFLGTNRTVRLASVKELPGRPGLLLALALDPDPAVAEAARVLLGELPGNAAELLKACCLSGEDRLVDTAMLVLARLPVELLGDFDWLLRARDPALRQRASRLMRERGFVPRAVEDRVAMARALEDWPALVALGDPAIATMRSAVAATPAERMQPLLEALSSASNLPMANLLIDLYLLRDEKTASLAWPFVERNGRRLQPLLEKMLADGDILPATEAATLLRRLQLEPDVDDLLLLAASGDAPALLNQPAKARRFLLAEARNPDAARRLRGVVWMTLLQRGQGRQDTLSEAALARTYIRQMTSGTAEERAQAAVLIVETGTNALQALDALVALLDDETPLKNVGRGTDPYFHVKTPAAAAVYALTRCGSDAVPVLLKHWNDSRSTETERAQLAAALAQIPDKRSVDTVIGILKTDRRVSVCAAAIQTLALADPAASIEPLVDVAMRDVDPLLASVAFQSLRRLPAANREGLLRFAGEDATRTELVLSLVQDLRTPATEEAAVRLLAHNSSEIRSRSARMLDRAQNPATHRLLVTLLEDRSMIVQWSAASALDSIGHAAAPVLVDVLAGRPPDALASRLASMLARMTGENFGTDASAWRAWITAHPAVGKP